MKISNLKIKHITTPKEGKTIILTITTIFLLTILSFAYHHINNNFLFDGKKTYNLYINYNETQEKMDKKISQYISNKKITMSSPKTILDPYGTSPLSALTIFYTKKPTKIKLYLNDIYMTTFEKSNSHLLPIYGLKENYNNKITLIDDQDNKSTFYIKTAKLNKTDFYTYKSTYDTNEPLFLNTPEGKYAIDNQGNINWYMQIYNNEFKITDDKKIYMIDKYQRIIETDFMGRIYNQYYTKISYNNHKIDKLTNGNLMTIGLDFKIYELGYHTGNIVSEIDLLKIIKEIDSEFNIELDTSYPNYFQYNEKDNTLLLSIRGINAIINYDLNTKKIIWIFSNNQIFSSKFDEYKLIPKGNISYFEGQHTPYLDGNYLYVFNNNNYEIPGFDFSSSKKSSAIIYEINKKTVKQIYKYEDKYASGWYGSFYKQNNTKIINFGSIINDEKGFYSKVIELNQDNKIITELNTNFGDIQIYESLRESFYNEITPNYKIDLKIKKLYQGGKEFQLYSETDKIFKGEKYFINKLKNAPLDETLIELKTQGIEINTTEPINILFVDKDYNYHLVNALFSEDYTGERMLDHYNHSPHQEGKYAIYIKINEMYYNSNLILNIK